MAPVVPGEVGRGHLSQDLASTPVQMCALEGGLWACPPQLYEGCWGLQL